ncbi:ROK family protein [Virgibacillus sp. NKC19-3]|uniref:ROK family protein n=1 Tax=Virgibacillus saliphilus TaxID=2831674 RepID=UPI001C9AC825|nr:ROK family protein [Virgibacillus sp. NKC19-3]MBY7142905.1 ROK family protein [Virgibacillus sp. NKC19-3]
MAEFLAIDIGGTYIKYAVINSLHQLKHYSKIPTKENEDNAILKQTEEITAEALRTNPDINGIGISTAGIVDREKGEIIYAGPTIKNYIGTKFKEKLTSQFHLPVHVENDVNAALLGEIWVGAAQNQNDVFCITLGTGIGGAYFHDRLIDGFFKKANSVGYLLYEKDSETNYEDRASTAALNKMIYQRFDKELSTKDVFELAKSGDNACMELLEIWSDEVAKGLAQIILLIDPKCIIIGGGISRQGSFLVNAIERHLNSYLPNNFLKAEIKVARLYNDAALYGAVYPFFKK